MIVFNLKKQKLILLIFLCLQTLVYSQQRYKVSIYGLDIADMKKINFDKSKTYDSTSIKLESNKFLNLLRSQGFIYANIDQVEYLTTSCNIHYTKGEKYRFYLKPHDKETQHLFELAGVNLELKSIDSTNTARQIYKLLNYLNDNGYPFANVQFEKINSVPEKIDAFIKVNKGSLVVFDSISFPSTINLNKSFFHKYLEMSKGEPYSQSIVLNSRKKLKELPFINVDTFPTITFIEDKAMITLPISRKGASNFDFILGFLPKTENGIRSWAINGDINADFVNKLGQGEYISFKGRQYGENDRQINFQLDYPYLFGSLFGFDGSFELFQNRNISTDAVGNVGLQYQYSGANNFKISWLTKTSRLSNIDTNLIKRTKTLPKNLDYNFNSINLGLSYRNLDYRFNPKSGLSTNITFNLGGRSIVENFQISNIKDLGVGLKSAYDTLQKLKFQLSVRSEIDYFIPLTSWSTLRLNNVTAMRISQGLLLENENIRIGGNRLLRGFDELSVLTDKFTLFNTEFRIILEKNSYLTLPFIEYSLVNVLKEGNKNIQRGISIGGGMNFSTQAGIFNIVFASGNNFNGGPKFNEAKIHFGYINLF